MDFSARPPSVMFQCLLQVQPTPPRVVFYMDLSQIGSIALTGFAGAAFQQSLFAFHTPKARASDNLVVRFINLFTNMFAR